MQTIDGEISLTEVNTHVDDFDQFPLIQKCEIFAFEDFCLTEWDLEEFVIEKDVVRAYILEFYIKRDPRCQHICDSLRL
jgi:hypothetical protein